MISFRHNQHLLPVDLDQSMPTCAEQTTHLHQEDHIPTVSQSTAVLNQYESITNDDVCPIPLEASKERKTGSSTPPLPNTQKARQRVLQTSQKINREVRAKENAGQQKQTTISAYFPKARKRPTLVELPQQRKISDFFKIKSLPMARSHEDNSNNSQEGKSVTPDLPHAGTFSKKLNAKRSTSQSVVQNKCNEDQVIHAPQFTRNIPLPPQPGQRTQARPIWQIELNNAFDELAITTHAVTGPELVVEVWYVHHVSYPECPVSRVVRLDGVTELWYADLCTAWWDKIQRTEPLKVLIVKPPPPHQVRPESRLHIILEQGQQPHSAVLLFTAFFHGDTRDGLFQQAESVPDAICTKDMIEKHNFQVFCQIRPCRVFSSRLQFQYQVREEIFSGMSALLDIGVPFEHTGGSNVAASSSRGSVQEGEMDEDNASFMQLPEQVLRVPAASLVSRRPPVPAVPGATSVMVHTQVQDLPPQQHRTTQPLVVTIANHAEFLQTLHWQNAQTNSECSLPTTLPKRISTWFSHPELMPRTDHPKDILLSTTPFRWVEEIIQAWADWIDTRWTARHSCTCDFSSEALGS